MSLGLIGGLALFLFGLQQLTGGLKAAGGSAMKQVLSKLTRNRFSAALAGTLVTAVIQSSSVTTVLVVGFISAGVLSFANSIGVILGANIGTTITAQIIAFKITESALLLVAVGLVLQLIAHRQAWRHYGTILIGLGLIFLGMEAMSDATRPLRDYQPFIDAMAALRNPVAGILVGATFTALVQSSSATTGIVIILASQKVIPLEGGIALVLGANIGTCVTALLSTVGAPRAALQAATAHVIFNVAGVLLWIAFIPALGGLVQSISPPLDVARQVANAHTIFNIANAVLFIGFTPQLARLIQRLIPEKPSRNNDFEQVEFIKDYYLDHPAQALDQAWRESTRLARWSHQMVQDGLSAFLSNHHEKLMDLREADSRIDELHRKIIAYLGRLGAKDLAPQESHEIYRCSSAANYWENIADIMETEFASEAEKIRDRSLQISPQTMDQLKPIVEHILATGSKVLTAFEEQKPIPEETLTSFKQELLKRTETVRRHLLTRIRAEAPDRLGHYRMEMDVLEHLTRIDTLYRRIAKLIEP